MIKRILLGLLLLNMQLPLRAQENKLAELLSEREQMILEYQYYNQQNNNFWGKKSKKDLLNIIESLKKVINKDSEIIKEINIAGLKKQAVTTVETNKIKRQVVDDKRVAMDNIYEMRQDLASLQNREKVKQRELQKLQEQLQEIRKTKHDSEKLLVSVSVGCILLLLYIFYLRSKIKAVKPKAARKK